MRKHKVVNINGRGISGVQKLLNNNPKWRLITCGQSVMMDVKYVVNFAVFETEDEVEFRE